jgi:RiboL-PSP-HEPN
MPSDANSQFAQLIGFVDQLVAIHRRLQTGRGRRHQQDALHRAGVVMTVAAWESYVEKVVLEAVQAIGNSGGLGGSSGSTVPAWAKHSFALRQAEIAGSVKRFHTPNSTNVRDLMDDALGFKPWPHWSWHVGPRQWDESTMRRRLDDWVRIRHSVAHGFPLPGDVPWLRNGNGPPRLTLSLLQECQKFFSHLVNQTDSAIAGFLSSHHGMLAPW